MKAREGVEKRVPSYSVGGNGYSHHREQYRGSLKTKSRATISSSSLTPGIDPEKVKTNLKRYTQPSVHRSTI